MMRLFRTVLGVAFLALVVLYSAVLIVHQIKPLPDGVQYRGAPHTVPEDAVTLYSDRTFVDADGIRHSEQQIFDEVFSMIEEARHVIVLDMFLFNNFQGETVEDERSLTDELTRALIEKKDEYPDITVVFITDPINTVYGGYDSPEIAALEDAGVEVVITDLSFLRDSNPIYSSLWRVALAPFGNTTEGGRIPNIFDRRIDPVTVRSYLDLLNFRANHRKLILADRPMGDGYTLSVLVTSANPHTASSAHSNIAVRVDGQIWRDVMFTESVVLHLSDASVPMLPPDLLRGLQEPPGGSVEVFLITEGSIRTAILEEIGRAKRGDRIEMMMFYLSDRSVINALVDAAERGVEIRLLLDPNKDAFGREKGGIPNRPVAAELLRRTGGTLSIRWCATHGEQCHHKALAVLRDNGEGFLTVGSANLTRRNIGGFNLETNVAVSGEATAPLFEEWNALFDEKWHNRGGRLYSHEASLYTDDSWRSFVQYYIMERTGMSSF